MSKLCKTPPVVWWIDAGEDWEFSEFHQRTLDWISSLGLDVARLAPQAAVVSYEGGYELHVDEVSRRWDPLDEDSLMTVRRVVPVPEGSWPARPAKVDA